MRSRNAVEMSFPKLPQPQRRKGCLLTKRMAQTFACTSKGMRKNSNSGAPQAYAVVDCCKRLHKYMFPQTALIASNFSTVWGWGGVMSGGRSGDRCKFFSGSGVFSSAVLTVSAVFSPLPSKKPHKNRVEERRLTTQLARRDLALTFTKRLHFGSVAVGTGLGGRCIEEDLLPIDVLEQLVATRTDHISVFAFQRERRSLVVIKRRRLPLRGVVAVAALRNLIRKQLGELAAVDVFVALLAFLRRLLEVHIGHLCFEVWRLMAVNAGHGTVRTN